MKKITTIFILFAIAITMSGCSDDTQADGAMGQGNMGEMSGNGQGQPTMSGNQTVGLVTEVLGNEVTIEIGEMQGGAGAMGGNGNMPEDGSMPEGAGPPEDGEMPEAGQRGEGGSMPEGGQRGEGSEMPEGAERPSSGSMASGGGMMGEGTDYSELVTLTGETQTFNIPVGTPVMQFGTEMTFSQITEEMYISIALDDEDNVTSVNILG